MPEIWTPYNIKYNLPMQNRSLSEQQQKTSAQTPFPNHNNYTPQPFYLAVKERKYRRKPKSTSE